MTMAVDSYGYDQIDDPADLVIAIRELSRMTAWLHQFGDLAVEMVDVPAERVVGIRTVTSLVAHLRTLAAARLLRLQSRPDQDAVVVIEPGREGPLEPLSGAVVVPVVSVPAVATTGISSAVVTLRPGHGSVPQRYDEDTIVVGVFGAVMITWWDENGVKHQLKHRRHQHAHIRGGTRHCVYNAGAVPAVAVRVRATADVMAEAMSAPEVPPLDAIGVGAPVG